MIVLHFSFMNGDSPIISIYPGHARNLLGKRLDEVGVQTGLGHPFVSLAASAYRDDKNVKQLMNDYLVFIY